MKIAILLKSGPYTDQASRALQIAADLLAQGHTVTLYLLQEAVRFCGPSTSGSRSIGLEELIGQGLETYVLTSDAELRGLTVVLEGQKISQGSYESLVDLMESCDRVVGIL